ncbi:Multidrug resistance protein MdtA [subsurface metagenome]|nr:efflux RND transporter periplasmic adaptor subunit [Dehalococcoidia bacterium]
MKKWLISIIAMCLVGSILAGCVQQEMPLQTAEVTRGDLIISVSAKEGNLKMRHKEYLSFGTMGAVDEILVERGDKVIEGQVLAKLDIRPLEMGVGMAQGGYEMAQAEYKMAENNLMQTIYPHYTNTYAIDVPGVWLALEEIQNNLEEAQELLEQGEIEGAQALLELVEENTSKAQKKSHARTWALPFSVKLAELETDEARAALDMAKLELAVVELELAKATIIAPFDGIIADVYIDEGQQLSAMTYSSPAIYLVDPSNVEMSGEIDEIDISKVKLGQEAIITLIALPDKKVKGKVTFISPTGKVWEDEVSYKITITLGNPDEELKDGMSASAEIITNRRDNVLLIPNRAIQGSLENPWVEVVTDDETEKRQVTLGLSNGIYSEVLSGLKEGEKVVLPVT